MPFEFYPNTAEQQLIRATKVPEFLPMRTRTRRRQRAGAVPEVKLRHVKNPAPRASLGYAGPIVKLESTDRFFLGVLTFPIDPKQTSELVPETIRVFRWDSKDATFKLVEPSGLAEGYAWARVSSPGIYTLIGLPADPFKQTLIRVTSAVASTLVGMKKRDRDALLRSIEKTLTDTAWFESFGPQTMQFMFSHGWLPAPDFGFGFGGFPGDPEGPPPALPRKPGWDPGDDICPPMPVRGWPEGCLLPIVDQWRVPFLPLPFPIDLGWVFKGPINIPGHSTEVQIDPGDRNRIYTATANGGLWVLDDVTRYPLESRWRPLTALTRT
jgi:hypothetical protein